MCRIDVTDLFRTSELLVRHVKTGSRLCAVSFQPWNDTRTSVDCDGFGEDFFCKRLIDAIHVIPRDNNWYHVPGIFDAVQRIADCAGGYKRAIGYGCSMGGYGALKFGARIGLAEILAISPQYSIDQAVCPFEVRWRREAASIAFDPAIEHAPKFDGVVHVFYDPLEDGDRQQVELIAREYRARLVEMPGTGHPTLNAMQERQSLGPTIMDVVFGRNQQWVTTHQHLQ
jgi:hypothetical protein